MPLIYGGYCAIMIGVISFNNRYYHEFRTAYDQRVNPAYTGPIPFPQYTNDNLSRLFEYYRRDRDLTYILAGVLYVLNILDAYVDGELFSFDISDNLSFHSEPALLNMPDNDDGCRFTHITKP